MVRLSDRLGDNFWNEALSCFPYYRSQNKHEIFCYPHQCVFRYYEVYASLELSHDPPASASLCWDNLHTPLLSDFPLSFRKGFQILIKSVYFWMKNTIILLCRKCIYIHIWKYVCVCTYTTLQCHDNFTDLILLLLLVFHTPYVSIYFLIFCASWNQTQGSVHAT